MIRLSVAAVALLALALPVAAQELEDPCAPATLFEAFGIEPVADCEIEEDVAGVDGEGIGEEEATRNPVSIAAKLPGNNREAALAHANERSNGAVEAAHSRNSDSESGNGNGKGGGKR